MFFTCTNCSLIVGIPTSCAWPQACPHCAAAPFVSRFYPSMRNDGTRKETAPG